MAPLLDADRPAWPQYGNGVLAKKFPIRKATPDMERSRSAQRYVPGRPEADYLPDGNGTESEEYEWDHLRPTFPNIQWPALEEIPYEDKGIKGDPGFNNLLRGASDGL